MACLIGTGQTCGKLRQDMLNVFNMSGEGDEEDEEDEAGASSCLRGDSSGARAEADMDSEQREERQDQLQVRYMRGRLVEADAR